MLKTTRFAIAICLLVSLSLFACSDHSGNNSSGTAESTALMAQFGDGADQFRESALQALLDYEDTSGPVSLVQVMSVMDPGGFARYEAAFADVLQSSGAEVVFASRVVGQLLGDRQVNEIRVIEFPNSVVLLDALRSAAFASAMDILFDATVDHAWVLGMRETLPFEFNESYFDPRLQNLSRADAVALLTAGGGNAGDGLAGAANPETLIDLVVSDSPEPFYMVNLIDYYDMAHYGDERDLELTGREADNIYGQTILPILIEFNSGPAFLMDVDVVLTVDSIDWERVAIARYASRDAFLNAFTLNPDADGVLVHKSAGVENTLVWVTEERHANPPEPVSGYLYNLRYCEIILATIGAGGITADVYGTVGLNACPQEAWDMLDRESVAADFGVSAAVFNGPRFFVTDWGSNTENLASSGESIFFGGLEMQFLTTVVPGAGSQAGGASYTINRVARDNVWHFVAGRRIYQLEDPDGRCYIMQSYSHSVDASLRVSDLASLGERLDLPPGWGFSSRELLESLALPAIDGTAEVVQDELQNTYQLATCGG